jgi:hypothetical protein
VKTAALDEGYLLAMLNHHAVQLRFFEKEGVGERESEEREGKKFFWWEMSFL